MQGTISAPGHWFQYEPLPQTGEPWIRVLELEPRSASGINVKLKSVKLGEHPPFIALSYSWGTDLSRVPVWCNGRKFNAPRSLWIALHRLCSPSSDNSMPTFLWADAMCINQNDTSEKTTQVRLMQQIYGAATSVIVWLGEEANGSHEAIEMVKHVAIGVNQFYRENLSMGATYTSYHSLVQSRWPDLTDPRWSAYIYLLRRAWFARVWVIQEVALASEAVVVCGADKVGWDDFWLVAREISTSGMISYFPPVQTNLGQLTLIGMIRHNVRQSYRQPLIEILFMCRPFQATDGRDKLFALYSLLHNDCRAGAIQPDYSLQIEDVFRKSTVAVLQADRSLDILSGPINGYLHVDGGSGPSWSTNWTVTDVPSPLTFQHVQRDPQFQASGGAHFEPRFSAEETVLEVAGRVVDTIAHVGLPSMPAALSAPTDSWVDMAMRECEVHRLLLSWQRTAISGPKQKYFNGEEMVDVYWQTLLGGFTTFTEIQNTFGGSETSVLSFYRTLFNKWQKKYGLYLNLHRFLHWLPGVDYLCLAMRGCYWYLFRSPYMRICALFGKVMPLPGPQFENYNFPGMYRRLFRTEKGYIGLAPRFADVGDKIAILQGGRVAYALRPLGGRWRLMGDAYIHGFMHGEAARDCDWEKMLIA